MDLPLEGRISGPSTGFEVTVPGRQGIRAMRNSIPLAGAPTSIETSLRGLFLLLCPVPSRGVAAAPRALLTCARDQYHTRLSVAHGYWTMGYDEKW
jgi:hypothetical protein